jgi:hypothetical protein
MSLSELTPSDIYRMQWAYKEQSYQKTTCPTGASPHTPNTPHCVKEPLQDLLRRISDGTKDEGVRKAISAFHHDQGKEHLSGEEPSALHHAELKHHGVNNDLRKMSRGERARKFLETNTNILKTDTRRERARKTRRNSITKFEEIRRNATLTKAV